MTEKPIPPDQMENHIPPDSAEYLAGPMPKYANGTFTIHGKKIDANKLESLDPEPPKRKA